MGSGRNREIYGTKCLLEKMKGLKHDLSLLLKKSRRKEVIRVVTNETENKQNQRNQKYVLKKSQ